MKSCYAPNSNTKTMKLMKTCGIHHSDSSLSEKIKFVQKIMATANFNDATKTKKETPKEEPKEPALTKEVYSQIYMFASNLKAAHVNCNSTSIADIIKAMLQKVMSR